MTYVEKIQFIESYCSNPELVKAISNSLGGILQYVEMESKISTTDLVGVTLLVTDNLLSVLGKRTPEPKQLVGLTKTLLTLSNMLDQTMDSLSKNYREAYEVTP